jgi:hypothetical protein
MYLYLLGRSYLADRPQTPPPPPHSSSSSASFTIFFIRQLAVRVERLKNTSVWTPVQSDSGARSTSVSNMNICQQGPCHHKLHHSLGAVTLWCSLLWTVRLWHSLLTLDVTSLGLATGAATGRQPPPQPLGRTPLTRPLHASCTPLTRLHASDRCSNRKTAAATATRPSCRSPAHPSQN